MHKPATWGRSYFINILVLPDQRFMAAYLVEIAVEFTSFIKHDYAMLFSASLS